MHLIDFNLNFHTIFESIFEYYKRASYIITKSRNVWWICQQLHVTRHVFTVPLPMSSRNLTDFKLHFIFMFTLAMQCCWYRLRDDGDAWKPDLVMCDRHYLHERIAGMLFNLFKKKKKRNKDICWSTVDAKNKFISLREREIEPRSSANYIKKLY